MKRVDRVTKRASDKVVLLIGVLSVLGIILSSIEFRASIRDVQLQYFQDTLRKNARNSLADMNHQINRMVAGLEKTANAIGEYDDFQNPDIIKILNLSNEINGFDFTAVADAEGNGYDNSGNTFNNAERSYYQKAMEGRVAFSEIMDSMMFPGDRVQIIAHPIREDDQTAKGVVFSILNLENLVKFLHMDPSSDNDLYIIDSCGAYIGNFQEDESRASKKNFWEDLKVIAGEEQIAAIKHDFDAKKEGEFSYVFEDETYYSCYMPIGPNKWQLVYSVSDSSADKIVEFLYALDTKNSVFELICYLLLIGCIVWYVKKSDEKIRKAHRESKKNMKYVQAALEHSKNIVFEYNQRIRVVRLKTDIRNPLFCCGVMTYVPRSFVSLNVLAPDSIQVFEQLFKTIRTEASCQGDVQVISQNKEIWYRISMNNIYDDRGTLIDTVGSVVDVSAQKKREEEIKEKLMIQDTLISNALSYAKVDLKKGILLELDGQENRMRYQNFINKIISNKVIEEQKGYVQKNLSLESLRKEVQQDKEVVEIQFLMKQEEAYRWVSCCVYRVFADEANTALFIISDIDDKKREEIALKERAERDGLTGLYNATTARTKISEILSQDNSMQQKHVFVLFDLDNYKQINDTFGHDYGDQVLVEIANLLNERFRSSDIVGRLGGDEFIVLLRDIKSYDYAEYLIDELCKSIHKIYREGGKEVTLSASVGMAMSPDDGTTIEQLYKRSDIAQYEVKKNGKNGYKRYEQK